MKIQLDEILLSYDDKEVTEADGDGGIQPISVRKALEIACLAADPTKWKTGEQKYEVYSLLKRISAAGAELEFSAPETVMLKELIGGVYGPGVVGVVYDLLDPPTVTD